MRRKILILLLSLALMFGVGTAASALELEVAGRNMTEAAGARLVCGQTYVALRAVMEEVRPDAQVSWEGGKAVVRAADLELTAIPGTNYIMANGRAIYVPDGILLENGRTLVPLRPLAKALGAEVTWDGATATAGLVPGGRAISGSESYYGADDLYWLSRIISAESRGEPLVGKIAVGNVVLNRVKSDEFPDTIYEVIFDSRWGGQFEPVRNGTVYNTPTEESVLAAKLVLDGANTAGESLYFLAPDLTSNHWTMENRPYVTTIGCHWFYA